MIENSENSELITLSTDAKEAMDKLRKAMFEMVYHNPQVKKASDLSKVENIITSLYDYFLAHPEKLPDDARELADEFGVREAVKDHIAGMTDRYAINLYDELFIPKGWK